MLLDIDLDSGFYLVPPVGGLGLKIGDHRFSMQGHPDAPLPTPASDELKRSISFLKGFSPPAPIAKTCFYTVASEESFMYKRMDGVHILTGFSGHGFKFGPVIGDRFAELFAGELEAVQFTDWLAGG